MSFSCNIRFWHGYLHRSGFITPQGYQTLQGGIMCAHLILPFIFPGRTRWKAECNFPSCRIRKEPTIMWACEQSWGHFLWECEVENDQPQNTQNNVKGPALSSIHFLKAWNAADSSRLYSEVVGGRILPGEHDIWDFMGFQEKLINQPLMTKEASCMGQCSPPTE